MRPAATADESANTAPVLDIARVTRRWASGSPPVLDEVDLQLAGGQIAWIGGANGAGKTTLLRIIGGLLRADSGEVRLDGRTIDDGRAWYHARVGFLSAGDRGLLARLTVRQQLQYWAHLAFLGPERHDAAIDEVVGLLGLSDLLDRRLDRLSLGQRQRVRLAMSFMHRPRLLVLDEPRNSLDDAGYQALNAAVRSVTDRGGAVIWCSPRGEDRVVEFDVGLVLENGRLEPSA